MYCSKKMYFAVSEVMRGFLLFAGLTFAIHGQIYAQLSTTSYRALGQPNLRQNGVNLVQGLEMYNPNAIALDGRDGTLHLYISDTRNHRVLAWQDARAFQNGDPPAIILGQPGPQGSGPLGIGIKGFNAPTGLAVDPNTGNLYVSDFNNNRVLRFPAPFSNPGRVEPDAVYGQANFNNVTTDAGRNSLNKPRGLTFDTQGNLWVADSGNHRIIRYNAGALDALAPEADLVIGQRDFTSSGANRSLFVVAANGLDTPAGLAFDRQNNLFVSDFNNARLLRFSQPFTVDSAANVVFGQSSFITKSLPSQASASTLAGPQGMVVDANNNLYVAVPNDNRVLVFAANSASGTPARDIVGQVDFTSTQANPSTFPYASAGSFAGVSDVKVDPDGNLYFADTSNNRIVSFANGAKTATKVWGQLDFRSNGANRVKSGSMDLPFKVAIDYSQSPYALYVSDANNHRILGWRDAVKFRTGDPADFVIGQPDFDTGLANIDTRSSVNPSATSLSSPRGIAIDADGSLYVADGGNNRVLRYPRPTSQSGRITPDLVLGQSSFTSSVSAAVTASSLNLPSGVSVDSEGNIFVADTGNNRVLQFASGSSSGAAAIRVFGQSSFTTGLPSNVPSPQTLSGPQGIFVDAAFSLYVADTGANRVLVFPNTKDGSLTGPSAAIVLGQPRFDTSAVGGGNSGLRTPRDLSLDSAGNIYVADSGNNRVLIFPSLFFLSLSGAVATGVVGQRDFAGLGPNFSASQLGLVTAEGLTTPYGIFVDRRDTLYVSDAGNSRVLHFLKAATITHAANSASGTPLPAGGLASITGAGLSADSEKGSGSPLPMSLAGREVVLNDELSSPLFAVGPDQVDFQVPSAAPIGTARIAIRASDTGELVAGSAAAIAGTSPGLFTDDQVAKGQGRILNQDGSTNGPTNAAVRGSSIKIFGTGQGPVSPAVQDGYSSPSDVNTVAVPTSDAATCLNRQPSVCVAIGSTFGEIQFSGLVPQMVGMWQLTVKVPATAALGNAVGLRVVINGVPSNIVNVAIK